MKERLDIELSFGEIYTCRKEPQTFWFVFKGLEVEIDDDSFEWTVVNLERLEEEDMTQKRVKLHTETRAEVESLLSIAELKTALAERIRSHNASHENIQLPSYKMGEAIGWRDDNSDTPEEIREVARLRLSLYLNYVKRFIR